jgi:hypothetical protein
VNDTIENLLFSIDLAAMWRELEEILGYAP